MSGAPPIGTALFQLRSFGVKQLLERSTRAAVAARAVEGDRGEAIRRPASDAFLPVVGHGLFALDAWRHVCSVEARGESCSKLSVLCLLLRLCRRRFVRRRLCRCACANESNKSKNKTMPKAAYKALSQGNQDWR